MINAKIIQEQALRNAKANQRRPFAPPQRVFGTGPKHNKGGRIVPTRAIKGI